MNIEPNYNLLFLSRRSVIEAEAEETTANLQTCLEMLVGPPRHTHPTAVVGTVLIIIAIKYFSRQLTSVHPNGAETISAETHGAEQRKLHSARTLCAWRPVRMTNPTRHLILL